MNNAQQLSDLLKTRIKGIKAVSLDDGMYTVGVSSRKAAMAVSFDLRMSRAFQSVTMTCGSDGDIAVHAVVK